MGRDFMLNIFYKKYKNAKLNLPEGFTITAHTGCMGTQQNSLDSMKIGQGNGANIVEFDLRANENGDLVLSHDEPKGGEIPLNEAFALLSSFENTKANVDIKMMLRESADNLGLPQNVQGWGKFNLCKFLNL